MTRRFGSDGFFLCEWVIFRFWLFIFRGVQTRSGKHGVPLHRNGRSKMAYKQKGKLASSSACFFLGGGLEIIFDIFTPA